MLGLEQFDIEKQVQYLSPAAKDVVSLFYEAKVIEKRLKEEKISPIKNLHKIDIFIKEKIIPSLQKILLKHFNIKAVFDVSSKTNLMLAAVIPDYERIEDYASELEYKFPIVPSRKNSPELDQYIKKLFDEISKADVGIKEFKFKDPMPAMFFIDFKTLLFSDLLYGIDISPEEVAAILFHEIGHVFSTTSRLRYENRTMYAIDQVMFTIMNKSDQKPFDKTFIGYLEKLAPKLVYDQQLIKDVNKYYEENLAKIKKIPIDKIILNVLQILSGVFGTLFIPILNFLLFVSVGIALKYISIIYSLNELCSFLVLKNRTATTTGFDPRKYFLIEESNADRFVSLNGLGNYLITALEKILKLKTETAVSKVFISFIITENTIITPVYYFSFVKLYAKLMRMFYSPLFFIATSPMYNMKILDPHGSMSERILSILQSTITLFKNENYPPCMYESLIKDYKEIERKLNGFPNKLRKLISWFMEDLSISIINVIIRPADLKILKDLFDSIQKTMYNHIYYQQARIKVLLNKN